MGDTPTQLGFDRVSTELVPVAVLRASVEAVERENGVSCSHDDDDPEPSRMLAPVREAVDRVRRALNLPLEAVFWTEAAAPQRRRAAAG